MLSSKIIQLLQEPHTLKGILRYFSAAFLILLILYAKSVWDQNILHMLPFIDRVAREDVLVTQFEKIVFENEFGGKYNFLKKWRKPMSVVKLDRTDFDYTPIIENHLNSLARLTGLKHRYFPIGRIASVIMRFTARENVEATMKNTSDLFKGFPDIGNDTLCAAQYTHQYGIIWKAGVIITENKEIGDPEKRSLKSISECILEELTQAMGMPNDTELIWPSIFSEAFRTDRLSINDKIIIRTLYDPPITPGMKKDAAMAQVRIIIPELIKTVEERGEEALHQKFK